MLMPELGSLSEWHEFSSRGQSRKTAFGTADLPGLRPFVGWEVVNRSAREMGMRTSVFVVALLVGSCGSPSDNFPVADFALGCASLDEPTLRTALDAFAKQEGLEIDLQVSSPKYLRLRMDGEGFGHSTYVEFWSINTKKMSVKCRAEDLPCVDVTVFTGGLIPDDEGTENTVIQEGVAGRLERAINDLCSFGRT